MSNLTAYIILIIAVALGTASNGFAKAANGFTIFLPSVFTAITIVACMYTLSLVMKTIPVGVTYASFAGLCIIATSIVGIYKFNQILILFLKNCIFIRMICAFYLWEMIPLWDCSE